ncbi:MAG: CheR family methyltransferase [Phycisphaerales bacterium]
MNLRPVQHWLVHHAWLDPVLLEGPGFEALIVDRMRELRCNTEQAYVQHLAGDAEEIDRVTAAIAVPETWLFRYPASFELLGEFLRGLLNSAAQGVRVLSLGCASGEEPYSIAMTALHAGWMPGEIIIHAIDRNPSAIERAKMGRFGQFSLREDVPAWAVAHLTPHGDEVEVSPLIRSMVQFRVGDMMAAGALTANDAYDVVFCRNVLIYLNAGARERLLGTIAERLRPGGLLFVGHAEPLLLPKSRYQRLPNAHSFAVERADGASRVEAVAMVRPERMVVPERTRVSALPEFDRGAAVQARVPVKPGPSLEEARLLANAGKVAESEAMVKAILARSGPDAAALELLGTLRMAARDPEQARRHFEQAVYLEPTRTTSLLQLALIREKVGDHSGATLLWERAKRAGGQS